MNIGRLLKTLYVLLLKGKTLKVGGGSITFPEKGNGPDFPDNQSGPR
jgi:hypothetical protein